MVEFCKWKKSIRLWYKDFAFRFFLLFWALFFLVRSESHCTEKKIMSTDEICSHWCFLISSMHTKCLQVPRVLLELGQACGNWICASVGIFVIPLIIFRVSVGSQSFHGLLNLEIERAHQINGASHPQGKNSSHSPGPCQLLHTLGVKP